MPVLAHFETMAGPFNGAKIVAHAWVDPDYKQRLIQDTPKAIAELSLPLGMAGAEGEHMAAVANDANVHNLIICTLCSCYPWPVLGLPPYWYKDPVCSRARRARAARGVAGIRRDRARGEGSEGVGQRRANPLVRRARAAREHWTSERGRTRRARHAGIDDGRRARPPRPLPEDNAMFTRCRGVRRGIDARHTGLAAASGRQAVSPAAGERDVFGLALSLSKAGCFG